MSTSDDDSRHKAESIPSSSWWQPGAEELRVDRKAEQVRLIVEAFSAAGTPVGIYPDDDRPGDMEFMYRKDQLLTRDGDADRVLAVLGRGDDRPRPGKNRGDDRDPDLAGLYVIQLNKDEPAIPTLRLLDRELGTGIVAPDHVVHITGNAGACPATEPLPSAGHPVPGITTNEEADGTGVLIAVVDTGVLPGVVAAHPWLTGITGDLEPPTVGHYRGHGTFVAGVARTMAPRAEVSIEALLVIGGAILESDLAVQLAEALTRTPDIISMSAGTTTWLNLPLLSLEVFWEERLSKLKGTVLVCAAGNDGDRGPFYPAASPWTVSVGALDADGARAGYSDFGSWVDVYARGSDMVNAYPTGTYTYAEPPFAGQTATFLTGLANWSGTSFSTPLVSGLIAARMSWSGESAEEAADTLLEMALENATPRVGKVLEPGMGDRPVF